MRGMQRRQVESKTTLQDIYMLELYLEMHEKSRNQILEGTAVGREEYVLNSVMRELVHGRGLGYDIKHLDKVLELYTDEVVLENMQKKDKLQISQGVRVMEVFNKIENKLKKEMEDAEVLCKMTYNMESWVKEYISDGKEDGINVGGIFMELMICEVYALVLENIMVQKYIRDGETLGVTVKLPHNTGYKGAVTSDIKPQIETERVFTNIMRENGYNEEKGSILYKYYEAKRDKTEIPEEMEEIERKLKDYHEVTRVNGVDARVKYMLSSQDVMRSYMMGKIMMRVIASIMKENNKKEIEKNREQMEIEKDYRRIKRNADRVDKQLGESASKIEEMQEKVTRYEQAEKVKGKTEEEIEKYEKEIKKQKAKERTQEKERLELEDELSKEKGRIGSYQQRIENLEARMQKYSSMEDDLMEISLENTNLKNDIEELARVEDEPEDKHAERVARLADKRVLLIGGIGSGIEERLQKDIPNLKHIDVGDTGVNFKASNQNDIIVIYTRVVSHSHVNRVRKEVGVSTPIVGVNFINNRLIVKEIDRIMHG